MSPTVLDAVINPFVIGLIITVIVLVGAALIEAS